MIKVLLILCLTLWNLVTVGRKGLISAPSFGSWAFIQHPSSTMKFPRREIVCPANWKKIEVITSK